MLATAWLVVVVATLSGCDDSSEPSSDNLAVLTGPTNPREVCVGAAHGPDYTVGVADAQNLGDEPVTVTDVELTDAQGMEATSVELLVIDHRRDNISEFGVWNSYPPDLDGPYRPLRALWKTRTPALGATLPNGEDFTLNFVLRLTGSAGAASGPLAVSYEDADGSAGTWTTNVTYAIRDRC